jgi:excisionase family DNA binding protein
MNSAAPTDVMTLAMVAERWACSERVVRRLVDNRELEAFRLGKKLIRIPRRAVEDYECRTSLTASGSSEADSPSSSGETESASATRSAPMTRLRLAAVRQRYSQS